MKYINFFIPFLLISVYAKGQDLLTRERAVEMALEFNYDIKVANNNVDIARNNAGLLNSGYLPTLSGTASAGLTNNSVKNLEEGGLGFGAQGKTYTYNSGIAINYVLFDGFGRKYTFDQSKELSELSEIQQRLVIENAILQLFVSYFEVARLTENEITQRQSLQISKERLLRAKYGYEYGQSTQLDVLNAEVDVNTDSINYLTIIQQVENVKRDLNLLLGQEVSRDFEVDTSVYYLQDLNINNIIESALVRNANIQQSDKFILNSRFNININRSNWLPTLSASAAYNWRRTDYETDFFTNQATFGPNASLNLSWNLFDGGITQTRIQNAKIALESEMINRQRTEQQLYRDLNNAWTVYETSLFVLEAQRKNLETNQNNFERTLEQNKLGQITSIVFRQAQINLINAQLSFNRAKYEAKIAELALIQLSGNLLNIEF